jgi:N-acyl-D-aspartate/D-glutamate deacylase
LRDYTADKEVNANGLAVAPGFINTLSWSVESLIYDGRGMSEIKQGVTLEIFGEGNSMGPVNDRVREEMIKTQGDIHYDVTWKTLGEYLDFLVKKGVSPNVARSWAPRPCARMWSASTMSRPRRHSSSRCRSWCARRCAKARSASAAR